MGIGMGPQAVDHTMGALGLVGSKARRWCALSKCAVGLGFATRTVWAKSHQLWLLDFLLPVCLSLAVIRLGVKVLQAAFKQASWIRPVERSVSWLAWGAVVLWLTGLLPLVLEELDQIHWKVGTSHLSVRTLIEGGLQLAWYCYSPCGCLRPLSRAC